MESSLYVLYTIPIPAAIEVYILPKYVINKTIIVVP
jgi:hypothetical protein